MSAPLEIERVWLLRRMPDVPDELLRAAQTWEIEQGYLPPAADGGTGVGADDPTTIVEGRLRSIRTPEGDARFVHTIKRGLGRVREEVERTIDEASFDRAWPGTAGRRLRKTRLRIPFDGRVIELDRFHHLPRELVLVEVELERADEDVVLPAWLAEVAVREVTEEPAFRNFELARRAGSREWLDALIDGAGAVD